MTLLRQFLSLIYFVPFFEFYRQLSGLVVEALPSLHELNLHENNWFCDCNIRDLRKWMSAQKIPFIYSPICHQPFRLKEKSWKIIDIDEFACKPRITSIKGDLFYEGLNFVTTSCFIFTLNINSFKWYIWYHLSRRKSCLKSILCFVSSL